MLIISVGFGRDQISSLSTKTCLDTIPFRDIISGIENILDELQPEILVLQGPSFHQDHTIVYNAAIAATRPTARFCPSDILIMENPTYIHSQGPSTDFRPNFYLCLSDEQLDRKLTVFAECFPTQVRQEGNALSPSGIRAWARYRGIEARCEYAEAFEIFRSTLRF